METGPLIVLSSRIGHLDSTREWNNQLQESDFPDARLSLDADVTVVTAWVHQLACRYPRERMPGKTGSNLRSKSWEGSSSGALDAAARKTLQAGKRTDQCDEQGSVPALFLPTVARTYDVMAPRWPSVDGRDNRAYTI